LFGCDENSANIFAIIFAGGGLLYTTAGYLKNAIFDLYLAYLANDTRYGHIVTIEDD